MFQLNIMGFVIHTYYILMTSRRPTESVMIIPPKVEYVLGKIEKKPESARALSKHPGC